MGIENKGPGGVGNSYGTRSATNPTLISSKSPKDVYSGMGAEAPAVWSDPTGTALVRPDGSVMLAHERLRAMVAAYPYNRHNNRYDLGAMSSPPTITADAVTTGLTAGFQYDFQNAAAFFRITGGPLEGTGPGVFLRGAPVVSGVNNESAGFVAIVTDAPTVQFWLSNFSTDRVRVIVNGRYASLTGTVLGGTNPNYLRIANGSRAVRRIGIELSVDLGIYGLNLTDATCSLFPPRRSAPLIYLMADSTANTIAANTGVRAAPPHETIYGWLNTLTGADVYCGAQGGTGYTQNGSTKYVFGDPVRVAHATASGADCVMICGGVNDSSNATSVQAAAELCYSRLRAGLPNAPIIVFGPWKGTSNTGIVAVNAAIAAAVAARQAAGDKLIAFVPTQEAVVQTGGLPAWLYGTGKATATNGSGNTDVMIGAAADDVHPTILGGEYWSRRAVDALIASLRAML